MQQGVERLRALGGYGEGDLGQDGAQARLRPRSAGTLSETVLQASGVRGEHPPILLESVE